MEHSITMVKRRLEPYHNVPSHAILLLTLLKQMLLLLHAVLRGSLTLEDLQVRLRYAAHDPALLVSRDDMDLSSYMESNDSDSNCDQSGRPLENAVHTLCRAIVRRDLKITTRILDVIPSLASKRHDGGWTPLHAAVLTGDVDIVKHILCQPTVDINSGNVSHRRPTNAVREAELGTNVTHTQGATPLHYACMIGNFEIIKILVEYGAALDPLDDDGRTPIEYFDMRRHAEAIAGFRELSTEWRRRDEFYKGCFDIDELANLVRNNEYDLFERSIRQNPNLASNFTYYDYTLLHLAVIRQRRPFVELLISIDPCGVNTVDERSRWSLDNALTSFAPITLHHEHVKDATPLHYACLTQNIEIIELLLKAGADWNIKDGRGRKPEELLYDREGCEHIKCRFAQLRDSEINRRKSNDKGICGYTTPCIPEDLHCEQDDVEKSLDDNLERNEEVIEEPAKLNAQSLLALEKVLGDKLIGQVGPIRSAANAIRLRESGWIGQDRPLVMLFLGSSGVGKTELAKQLALYIHGKDGIIADKGEDIRFLEKEGSFIRIDMSEFQESHTALNLIGAPKSYVGYDDGGALTQSLKKNPRAIVLLDEIEKAHPDVLTLLLQVFDDGRLTDSKDGVIYCNEAVFIMTSNLASDDIKGEAPQLRREIVRTEEQGRPEEYLHIVQNFTRSIHHVLKQALRRDEFLGRINEMAVFLPLSDEEIHAVVERELALWRTHADKKHKIRLSWTEEVVTKLATAYDVNYGVRSVVNMVQRVAVQLVADAHIKGRISKNWNAHLAIDPMGDIVLKASDES